MGAGYAICRWLLRRSPGPEVSRAGSEGGQVDVKGGSRGILEPPRMGWSGEKGLKLTSVSCLFPPPTLVMGVIYSRIWCPWSWSEIDTWAGVQGPEGAGSREQVQGSRSVAASRQCPKPAHEGPWAWVITAPCVRC